MKTTKFASYLILASLGFGASAFGAVPTRQQAQILRQGAVSVRAKIEYLRRVARSGNMEEDIGAGSKLAEASASINAAADAAEELLALMSVFPPDPSAETVAFGRTCSQLGLTRLRVTNAKYLAELPPVGALNQFSPNFQEIISETAQTRANAFCP